LGWFISKDIQCIGTFFRQQLQHAMWDLNRFVWNMNEHFLIGFAEASTKPIL